MILLSANEDTKHIFLLTRKSQKEVMVLLVYKEDLLKLIINHIHDL
jgi:hypothetical protein